MPLSRDAVLLRIFIGEDDKVGHQPLDEAIVLKAREMHLAGATVLRGPLGFGRSSVLHTTKILRLSQDLPLVIEIVDGEDKIDSFLSAIEAMMGSALVTTEKVKVIRYGEGGALRPCLIPFTLLAQSRPAIEPLLHLALTAPLGRGIEALPF